MHLTQKHAEPAHFASKPLKECFGKSLWIRLCTHIKEKNCGHLTVAKEDRLEMSSFKMKSLLLKFRNVRLEKINIVVAFKKLKRFFKLHIIMYIQC